MMANEALADAAALRVAIEDRIDTGLHQPREVAVRSAAWLDRSQA